MTASSCSAARHRPRHQAGPFHDGDAPRNGLQRPAAEPAAAEEAQLQPAAHRQRAGADGRGQAERRRRAALKDTSLLIHVETVFKFCSQCKDLLQITATFKVYLYSYEYSTMSSVIWCPNSPFFFFFFYLDNFVVHK